MVQWAFCFHSKSHLNQQLWDYKAFCKHCILMNPHFIKTNYFHRKVLGWSNAAVGWDGPFWLQPSAFWEPSNRWNSWCKESQGLHLVGLMGGLFTWGQPWPSGGRMIASWRPLWSSMEEGGVDTGDTWSLLYREGRDCKFTILFFREPSTLHPVDAWPLPCRYLPTTLGRMLPRWLPCSSSGERRPI